LVAFAGGLPTGLTLAVIGRAFLAQHKADMDTLKKGNAETLNQLQELRVETAGKTICHAPMQPWQH
jgi:hypothetical protein